MKKEFSDQIIIDGLQYCNWNRELFEDAWKGGLTDIHATLVYWENTEESFEKIKECDLRFKDNIYIICHAKTTNYILEAKKITKLRYCLAFKIPLQLPMISIWLKVFSKKVCALCSLLTIIKPHLRAVVLNQRILV